jgi:hypothetical protein
MATKNSSEGICIYCNQTILKANMAKHLENHLATEQKNCTVKTTETYCHIEVQAGKYFLHLLVHGQIDMEMVDYFFKQIWLECCGHLSAFMYKNNEIEMEEKVQDILQPATKLIYEYDFGSTTTLNIISHNHYQLPLQKQLQLLSRNEPLQIMCDECNSNAAQTICTTCTWDGGGYFCKTCATKHKKTCEDFADYAKLPLVNSPRAGVCDYTGGSIDKARDGFYKPKIK